MLSSINTGGGANSAPLVSATGTQMSRSEREGERDEGRAEIEGERDEGREEKEGERDREGRREGKERRGE